MSVTSANRLELLQIADAVAREKMIDPSLVIEAMEDRLGKAARSRYGAEYDIRAKIDRKSGELHMTRYRHVVEEVENHFTELTLDDARAIKPDAELGDYLTDSLPPMDFGRIAAQSAKQVIMQKVREAERLRQYEEFKDREGEIINGIVKRTEYGNVIVDVGRGEAILRRDQLIQREAFRNGDRVRALIRDVRHETRGPQIFLSRTAPEFLAELFKMEVPEIYDGIIEIKAVARDPGSRGEDGRHLLRQLDRPGRRLRRHARLARAGGRRRAAGREDRHHPVEPGSGDLPRERAAAGRGLQGRLRRGQRADRGRGARRAAVARHRPARPERAAGEPAHRLRHRHHDRGAGERAPPGRVRRAHPALHGHAERRRDGRAAPGRPRASPPSRRSPTSTLDELVSIDGFDETTAEELQARARESLEEINAKAIEQAKELGVEQSLFDFEGLTPQMIEALAEDGIKTLEDFATCADWELAGGYTTVDGKRVKDTGLLEKFDMSLEEAQTLVMNARVQLGWVDAAELEAGRPRREAEGEPSEATRRRARRRA